MMHLAVMLEKRNLVDCGLNAQDKTELIVHFDREWSHLMLDARAQPTLIEAITHLALVVAIEFATQKSGNICGFDRLSKGFQEMWVEGLQSLAVFEDQVGSVLGLHDAPVITQVQVCNYWTISL